MEAPSSIEGSARYFVRGLASGAIVMTGFGTVWAFAPAGILSSGTLQTVVFLLVVAAIAIALIAASIALARRASGLPLATSPEAIARDQAIGRRLGIGFGIVFGTEALLCALASTVLSATNRSDFIVPVIVLIVGLHFLPLAWLFQVWPYVATGILLALAAVITMLATSATTTVNHVSLWVIIPATASTLILWLTAVAVLVFGRRVLRAHLPATA